MNRQCVSYVTIIFLCLNLSPQPSNAFKLNDTKDDVIYDSKEEKEDWETDYLPYAKHLKLVNKTTTILDIVKKSEEERNTSLITEIMNCTHHERSKLIVKWERDKGFIDKEMEEDYGITPTTRLRLLAEIKEEEKETEKKEMLFWKIVKTGVKVLPPLYVFGKVVYEKGFNRKDIGEACATSLFTMTGLGTIVEVIETGRAMAWNGIAWLLEGIKKLVPFGKSDEEIKLPPLRNLPTIPPNHTRVDIYK
jgi:hypothetical protein